jgi:hypothetical protein
LLAGDPSIRVYLKRFYEAALDVYFAGAEPARGCYSIGTAATEAAVDPAVRIFLADSIRNTDMFFVDLIRRAQDRHEIAANADPDTLARIATATLHTLAVRARAGHSREELTELAATAVDTICSR